MNGLCTGYLGELMFAIIGKVIEKRGSVDNEIVHSQNCLLQRHCFDLMQKQIKESEE